ncbi:MAG: hypothetical protein J5986_05515 [Roseburia sp.]|nr:hypothetical protein [Roseburia sp.]
MSLCAEELFEEERLLCGADLLNYKIFPYRGKLKTVIGKENTAENAYILMDTDRKHEVYRIPVNVSEEKKRIYIAEANFNRYWKNISSMIFAGLRKEVIGKQKFYPFQDMVETYVDLSFYENEHRKAVLEHYQVKIIGIQPTEEVQKLQSRRASAMDNKKLVYVYSDGKMLFHDKSCPLVKEISDTDFRACAELPENALLCEECRERMYIRRACGEDFKRYNAYHHFFRKGHVNIRIIQELVGDYQGKIHLEGIDTLRVICGEDTWKIRIDDAGKITLLHNNYVMVNDEERYILSEFHNQNLPKNISMTGAIQYLENYTWEKHLAAKKIAEEKAAEIVTVGQEKSETPKMVAAEKGSYGATVGKAMEEDVKTNTNPTGKKIVSTIRRLWQSIRCWRERKC